jgi:hypothetical protein
MVTSDISYRNCFNFPQTKRDVHRLNSSRLRKAGLLVMRYPYNSPHRLIYVFGDTRKHIAGTRRTASAYVTCEF